MAPAPAFAIMIPDATFEPAPPSKLRLRFSLLALFVFITLVCLLLAWWVQPRRVVATALFQVSSQQPSLWNESFGSLSQDQGFETVKQSQLVVLKEEFVINSALRDPAIASLPILSGRDAVAWLQDRLEVEFPGNSEILAIRLRGPAEYATELVQIVDAVAKAYSEQVLFVAQLRHQQSRDLLARSRIDLNEKITAKWQALREIANTVESGADSLPQEQLEIRTAAVGKNAVELATRQRELEQLQRLADEVTLKLGKMDIEAEVVPARIRQIQPAIAGPE